MAAPAAVAGIVVAGVATWGLTSTPVAPLLAVALLAPIVSIALYRRSLRAGLEASRLAVTDRLTGLGNDRGFFDQLELDLERALLAGDALTLCVIDVDDFKSVNDRYGHQMGDAVLLEVASCLSHGSRAFRLGGDEFALILPGYGEAEGRAIVEDVLARIAAADYPHGDQLTASAGIVTYPTQGVDRPQLLRLADGALYRAKGEGKNCVRTRRPEGWPLGVPVMRTGHEVRAGLRRSALALARAVAERESERDRTGVTVADLAARTASRLGLEPEEAELVRVAGGLNDIGKLALPDELLGKAGPLSEAERRTVERHPQIGYRILSSLGVDPVATWVLHHHERWDGCGYPSRLAGEEIPLGSRILFVVDAYEAMTTDQAWRASMTSRAALAELERCAGSQFDPVVVAAFAAELGGSGPLRLVV